MKALRFTMFFEGDNGRTHLTNLINWHQLFDSLLDLLLDPMLTHYLSHLTHLIRFQFYAIEVAGESFFGSPAHLQAPDSWVWSPGLGFLGLESWIWLRTQTYCQK